jgi:choline dehydrogenase
MRKLSADYVIVGGGAAGCVLAARLSENPDCSVVLLEAGQDFHDLDLMPSELMVPYGNSVQDERFLWPYRGRVTSSQKDLKPIFRGRVIGGSSTINGCIYLRGVPEDYDLWGSDRWSWDAVLPSFNAIENDLDFGAAPYHGTTGPMPVRRQPRDEWLPFGTAFREAALATGHADQPDLNAPGALGVGPMPRNIDASNLRMSAAFAYLLPARRRPNLTVVGSALATRILFDGPRATGVDAACDGKTLRVDAGEVIVSGGAIASPQLLMLSGVGPAGDLQRLGIGVVQELEGVGANLSDHPVCSLTLEAKPEFAHPGGSPNVQVSLFASAGTGRDLQIGSHVWQADPSNPPGAAQLYRFTCSLGSPKSRGRVSLTSTGPSMPPSIEYDYMTDEADLARMRIGLRTCAELAEHTALSEIANPGSISLPAAVLADDSALNAFIIESVGTAFHGMGTCRMGQSSDPSSVVDDQLRVHGLEGLRVVDASVAPVVTRANAHSTVLMIGEHAAGLMKAAA